MDLKPFMRQARYAASQGPTQFSTKCAQIMPLALLVLSTVPAVFPSVTIRVHFISPTHFLSCGGGYNGFALSRPSDGRSVGPSSVAGVCIARTSAICTFFKRCGNAVRTPLWCDMGFKYITMSEIYAVLVLWNITL